MTLDELRATLIGWLSQIRIWSESSTQSWEDYILTDEQWRNELYPFGWPHPSQTATVVGGIPPPEWKPDDNCLHLVLYTNDHRYHVSIQLHPSGRTYMGCTAQTRKPRAGENWNRGNDLHDGSFSWETFVMIMLEIVGFELKAKVKPAKAMPDDSESPPPGKRPLIEKVVPKDKLNTPLR